MPQHKKLSQLPLRINPSRPKTDQEWQAFLAQLQQHFNAIASIDLCSGLTKFSDAVNAGYYMGFTRNDDGYDDGIPVLAVGDRGNGKYVEFDGDDVNLGFKTELKGADHFNNTSTYIGDVFMGGTSGYDTTGTGGGATAYSASGGYAQVSVDGTSGAVAEIAKNVQYNTVGGTIKGGSIGNGSFDGLSRFKCTVGITALDDTNLDFKVGVGATDTVSGSFGQFPQGGMGIKIKNGRFYAYAFSGKTLGGGTTETEYDTGLSASTGTYLFAIEGDTVSINDTEYVTDFVTPSGWTGNTYFVMRLENTGASSTTTLRCSQWKVN